MIETKKNPLKEKPLRMPGQSLTTRVHELTLLLLGCFFVLIFVFYLAISQWWYWAIHLPPQPLAATLFGLLVAPFTIMKIIEIRKDIKNTKLGRDGEIIVGQTLDKLLGNGYAIFHDVPGKDFNIDHVVVSPYGVFAIETKTRSKPSKGKAMITYDGESIKITGQKPDKKPIEQAISNSEWLCKKLKGSTSKAFPVKPVVVFPGWWVESPNSHHRVWVLNPEQLEFRIPNEPRSLTQEEINMIAFHLSRIIVTAE